MHESSSKIFLSSSCLLSCGDNLGTKMCLLSCGDNLGTKTCYLPLTARFSPSKVIRIMPYSVFCPNAELKLYTSCYTAISKKVALMIHEA